MTSATDIFAHLWRQAAAGDPTAQATWQATSGNWAWQEESLLLTNSNDEWANLSWLAFDQAAIRSLKNIVIDITIRGKGQAAGFSFGHFKDFLVELAADRSYHLQLEIDIEATYWVFRIDGVVQNRHWWDSEVKQCQDLLDGLFALKARHAEQITFKNLSIYQFQSSARIAIIITCYRYLQRLRVTLRNWCEQRLPDGAYELLVVNPHSPDGTHEHLAAVAASYPHIRIRELTIDAAYATNKGKMINDAARMSHAEWIWLTDADCLFGPDAAQNVLTQIQQQSAQFYYGQRRYLSTQQTSELLAGRRDGLRDFAQLAEESTDRQADHYPWGYTQIMQRLIIKRIPYSEQVNHFAHTDDMFIDACRKHSIIPKPLEHLFCLHLDHPFAWYGTKTFL